MTDDKPLSQKIPVNIEDEMRTSYLDYAMSVIVGRALPDVRDGLKPVHRRVLFAMHEQRNTWNQAYKKSARIVGDVIGKYHPHGDAAVYDTIVRMAQDFSLRYLLVDGQGNFGSVDGDPPAAMRYTEVRMTRLAGELLADLEKETVDFAPNYDGSTEEPTVLPSKIPNLLVNGSSGIAVGMATNIPPHNLGEVIDATIALINNPGVTIDQLMTYVHGPDFPTYGFIYGREGFRSAYRTGRGIVTMRAKVEVESHHEGREKIIVTELPYQVNKAKLLERIAELVREKRIEGIHHLQDESDRHGMRVSIELKRDAIAQIIINQLFTMTPMQSSFGIINLAIVDGQPKILNLKEMLSAFVDHRREVVTRRCIYELIQAEARAHILEGYRIALDNIDEIVELIKTSQNPEDAKTRLIARFLLSDLQAQAILEMRLQRLTGLERDKILQELTEVQATITRLKEILANERLLLDVICDELTDIRSRFADNRRTVVVDNDGDISLEDLIAQEEVAVTISHEGYIKRMPVSLYRTQHRGGKGKRGASTKEEDIIVDLFVANTHTDLLIFTDKGRAFQLKVYELPEGGPQSRGKPIINLLAVDKGERIQSVLPIRQWRESSCVVFATRKGIVKKTDLMAYGNVASTRGIIAIKLQSDDGLVTVRLVEKGQHVLLASRKGQSIRFDEDDVRPMGRDTMGVRGMSLGKGDELIGMEVLDEGATVLTVTDNGYGKRTDTGEYRLQTRGGKGIITIKTGGRNGEVVAIKQVSKEDDLLIVTDGGQLIRMPVAQISVVGRNTMGVRLIHLAENENVVAVERVAEEVDEETLVEQRRTDISSSIMIPEQMAVDDDDPQDGSEEEE
ncbi:MAG: DNA gyrase subunit A [Myxococcales bacterium]|nr:DNA gyrase subunit A [Myxococcales bacterium]